MPHKSVANVSELLAGYDLVFRGRIDAISHYPNDASKWPETHTAKITILESFKGPLNGRIDFNFSSEDGSCSGAYFREGRDELVLLNRRKDSSVKNPVRAASYCAPINHYHVSEEQILAYLRTGEDPAVISYKCAATLENSLLFGTEPVSVFTSDDCAEYMDAYTLGNFNLLHRP